ncbi:hypothetical protein BBO99_00006446 [Phytophthora kernoviae]|uniref:Uncharacterized protein n=2 Tax=Phytophthora kernoviae TaxID=325452 RepID=A0A3R7GUJ7_9STRA|nr:hypothetical protein G195_003576 [Phytophthora kernoviae 00238/432]KAG2522256.1 hypothetical protein JM16_002234 [Phytophthora kernoviae]KAG2522867.1 hypothetical protein JM18_003954 [Phytophthora kernoviae]RLN44143.1 hypothetical protein BBI17_002623 [Phytophthora kernoviae]RLN77814.1 hypothetical protein BBO99_00006446 [Phytophthora kernoviae]
MVGTCASRPPLQRSISIDNHPESNRLKRTQSAKIHRSPCGLHHGFQMDLKQAVQLEKQELRQLGLLPPPIAVDPPLPKIVTPEEEEEQEETSQFTSTPPYWLAAAGLGEHLAHGVDAEQIQHLSQSQCEARLWDEFWNYKLSFESRESFEVLKISDKEGSKARANSDQTVLAKYRSEEARPCSAKDEEGLGPEKDEHVHHYGDVFEMDDL